MNDATMFEIDDDKVMLQWLDVTGRLIEVDMPIEDAEKLARGERVVARHWERRVYEGDAARARTRAELFALLVRKERLRTRQDELALEYPLSAIQEFSQRVRAADLVREAEALLLRDEGEGP